MLEQALALRWDEQEFTEVRPGIFGATIDTEQLTVTVYRYEPGCAWEEHSHPEDQVTCVVDGGTVEFVVDGRPTPLSPGQLALIPGGVPHAASVPADAQRVVTINVWRLRNR
ncbi:MAG TPA: cupin domain-containing protein [Solirubrobacteraceae bacterium]|jgi:quercetin dioxygenase-like cupin family protein